MPTDTWRVPMDVMSVLLSGGFIRLIDTGLLSSLNKAATSSFLTVARPKPGKGPLASSSPFVFLKKNRHLTSFPDYLLTRLRMMRKTAVLALVGSAAAFAPSAVPSLRTTKSVRALSLTTFRPCC